MRFTRANVMVNGVPATQYNPSTGQAELIYYDNVTENELTLLNSYRLGEVKLKAAESITIPSLWKNYGGYIKEKSIEQGAELSDKLSNVLNKGFGKLTEYASKFTDEINRAFDGNGGTGGQVGNQPYPGGQVGNQPINNKPLGSDYNPTNVEMKTSEPLNLGNPNGPVVTNIEKQGLGVNLGKQSDQANTSNQTNTSNGVNLDKQSNVPTKQYQKINVTPTKVSTGLTVELTNTDAILVRLDDSLASIGIIALVQPIYLGEQTVSIELQLININPYEIGINKNDILGGLISIVK